MPPHFHVPGAYAKFVPFGVAHVAVMALTALAPGLLALLVRNADRAIDKAFRYGFAALLVGTWIGWYALFAARGWLGIGNVLPMNLCDWATIALLVALLGKSARAFELAYAWAIAGTLQGLITPDVNYSFPEPQFVLFMLAHGLIVAAVIYLVFGTGLRPTRAFIPRVIGWTLTYAAAAGAADWVLGTNYGFLRAKPTHATLFDALSPWPYYLPEVVAIGVAAAFLLYLPWVIGGRLRGTARTRPAMA